MKRASGMLHTERVLALRRFPGLASLDPDLNSAFARQVQERFFRAGEYLLREGRPVTHPLLLLDGKVTILRGGVTLNQMSSLETVGFLSAFGEHPQGVSAVADTDCVALAASVDSLRELQEEHFEAMHSALRGLSQTLLQARQRLGQDAGFDPSPDFGTPVAGKMSIIDKIMYLRETFFVAGSRIEFLGEMARAASHLRFQAGEKLWEEGDASREVCLVVSGEIRAVTAEGQDMYFRRGDAIGSLDSIAEVPRWFSAYANKDVDVLSLDSETTLDLLEDNPDIGAAMIQRIARAVDDLLEERARRSQEAA